VYVAPVSVPAVTVPVTVPAVTVPVVPATVPELGG
jgi:hypothetical protein